MDDRLFVEYASFEWMAEYVACVRVVTPDRTAGVADARAVATTVEEVNTAAEELPGAARP